MKPEVTGIRVIGVQGPEFEIPATVKVVPVTTRPRVGARPSWAVQMAGVEAVLLLPMMPGFVDHH